MDMSLLSAFFEKNLTIVFFIYGLSFFMLAAGLGLSLKALRSIGLSRIFLFLLLFAFVHGAVEWIDMYRQYGLLLYGKDIPAWSKEARLYLLALSYYCLFIFGLRLYSENHLTKKIAWLLHAVFLISVISVFLAGCMRGNIGEFDSAIRYFLGLPSAALSALALFRLSKQEFGMVLPENYSWYLRASSCVMMIYAVFSGLIAAKSSFLFSPYLNQEVFMRFTGIPVQILRAAAAFFLSYMVIRSLALRLTHKMMAILLAFVALLIISLYSGYFTLKVVLINYNQVVKLETEARDFSNLQRLFNQYYNLSTNRLIYRDSRFNTLISSEYQKEFESILGGFESMHHESGEEEEMIDEIGRLYREYLRDGRFDLRKLEETKALINEINDHHIKELAECEELVQDSFRNFSGMMLIILAFTVCGLLFIWHTLNGMILRPIHKIRTGARQIAAGNLESDIGVNTADELQEFAADFNIMRLKLIARTGRLEAAKKELEELAVKDGLTGLYNHRFFYRKLSDEIKRAERSGNPLALLIMDLDDFKHYNDANGHPEGDALLRKIADIMRENLRSTDYACRHGGEEFSAILPETDREGAFIAAEKLRKAIEAYEFRNEKEQPSGDVTMTIGVSHYSDSQAGVDQLIKNADDALYEGKRRGKNRVFVFGQCPSS